MMYFEIIPHLFKNSFYNIKNKLKKVFLKNKYNFNNDSEYIKELKTNGVLRINWEYLFGESPKTSYLFQKLKFQAEKLYHKNIDENNKNETSKDKYVIFGSNVLETYPDPFLLAIGNNKKLNNLINDYFGSTGMIYGADYWLHKPSENKIRESAQNWHRDPENEKIIKVFIFIKKVCTSQGPTEFILRSHRTSSDLFLSNIFRNKTITPNGICERILKNKRGQIFNSIGEIGQVILMDTSGFHRGGYCREERLLANINYLPQKDFDGLPSWLKTEKVE